MMPELVQSIKNLARDEVRTVHTAVPGKIKSYDPETNFAVVTPCMQYKKPDGTKLDYPDIHDVPVAWPQGADQKASIVYPVKEGDGCFLIVSEEALDYWLYQRETSTELHYDLTNSIAFVGLSVESPKGIQQALDEDAVVVTAEETVLTVKPSGVDIIGNVTVQGTIQATGDITAGSVSLQNHTHTCPDGSTSSPN